MLWGKNHCFQSTLQTPSTSIAVNVYLQDFHLKPAVRRGAVWYLEGLDEGLCELLHHREDQDFGRALAAETKVSTGRSPNQWLSACTKHRDPRCLQTPSGSGLNQKGVATRSLEVSPRSAVSLSNTGSSSPGASSKLLHKASFSIPGTGIFQLGWFHMGER